MHHSILIPGKTFLLGEYAVLSGGPAVVINTKPYFKCVIESVAQSIISFSPQSPAGRYCHQRPSVFKHLSLSLNIPYLHGGLGGSGAEFLGVYLADLNNQPLNHKDLLNAFREHAKASSGIQPSGIDVLAQAIGQLTLVQEHSTEIRYQAMAWELPTLGFMIIHTGHKLKSHEHLQQLSDLDTQEMNDVVLQAQQAIVAQDETKLIQSIQTYRIHLEQRHLVCHHTHRLLQRITQCPEVLAAKGCGAMGSDTIVVLCQKDRLESLKAWFNHQNLAIVATHLDLAMGAHYDKGLS